MNLVVTGATSFLGAALIRRLLEQGHTVYGVVRPGSKHLNALEPFEGRETFHIVEMELERLERIREEIREDCDLFFHFGWDGSGSEGRKKADVQQKNAVCGVKALWGARSLGCRRFLFSGSQAEYGVYQTAMTEELACHPVSEYGRAKAEFCRQAAALCRRWREEDEYDLEYIHARIFSVYGPGDHPWSLVNTCLKTFQEGGQMELGACTQQWNFLYIDDLVKGLLALAFCPERLDEPAGAGIYNLAGAPESTMALRRYVEQMHRLCGEKGSYVYGRLAPNAEGPANLIPDISKIQEKTGWKPEITFAEGVRRMLEMEKETDGVMKQTSARGYRQNCIVCGHKLPEKPLMELEGMPASAQDIPGREEVETDHGISLRLCQCPCCGLVQFDCEPVDYYRDVIRSGGYSTTMVDLRTKQYRHLIDTYRLEGKKFLEVGCGRGEFLKVLTRFPVGAYGVEHRKALVEIAGKDGLDVVLGFTEREDTVLGHAGPYDVFLSFNFLEHQPHPGVMLDCIRNNLTEDGMGLITVPSLEYILQYDGYYELIRDHIAYYTFDTLRYLLEHHGFSVLEEEMVNRDTISVIVKKAETERAAASVSQVDISGLRASLTDIRSQMETLTERVKREGKRLAVWGAGHQGFTLAATTCLGQQAEYIIDSAPFKQGKFAPASHLPIVAPEQCQKNPADVILIVAPGYTDEIAASIRKQFGGKVQILTLRSDRMEELS